MQTNCIDVDEWATPKNHKGVSWGSIVEYDLGDIWAAIIPQVTRVLILYVMVRRIPLHERSWREATVLMISNDVCLNSKSYIWDNVYVKE